jgi:hypothetical protein
MMAQTTNSQHYGPTEVRDLSESSTDVEMSPLSQSGCEYRSIKTALEVT